MTTKRKDAVNGISEAMKKIDEELQVLFEQYFERLFYFSKKFVKSDEVARDVVSEVFLSYWNQRKKGNEIRDIRSYLYTSTKNESLRCIHKQMQRQIFINVDQTDHQWDFAIENYTPEDALLHQELQEVIEKSIEALPHQCKMVYRLVKEDGLKHDEVAKVMGISPNTVKNHVIKALKRARIAVEEYLTAENNKKQNSTKVLSFKMLQPIFVLFGLFL